MKRLILLLVSTALLMSCLVGCKKDNEPDAVIILPGIMGSELYLSEQVEYKGVSYAADTKLWLNLDSVKQVFAVPEHISMLAFDSGCKVQPSAPIVNDFHVRKTYGTLNTYSELYRVLYDEFIDTCDVVFYPYDWRVDPYETARVFDEYLVSQGYDNVIIVAHSMGGLVSSHFFAMGEAQRNKVHTYLSLGTPYLGSEQATYSMITGNISNFFANLLVSNEAKEICPKLDSMYALLPYEYLWRGTMSVYTLKDVTPAVSFEVEEDLLAAYAEGYSQDKHEAAKARKHLLFTEDGRHISELVNSYYLVGAGEKTVVNINVPNNVELKGTLTTTTKDPAGDGTVSLFSATVGGKLPSDRTFVKAAAGKRLANHNSLADGSDPTTLDFIIAVVRGEADSLSTFDLKSKYNIEKGAPIFD